MYPGKGVEREMPPKLIHVEVRPGYRLWLRYADGEAGEVDLSDLAGCGVFKAWGDRAFFESVRLGPRGELVWSDQIDLCPDSLYLRLTKKKPEQVFPGLGSTPADA